MHLARRIAANRLGNGTDASKLMNALAWLMIARIDSGGKAIEKLKNSTHT